MGDLQRTPLDGEGVVAGDRLSLTGSNSIDASAYVSLRSNKSFSSRNSADSLPGLGGTPASRTSTDLDDNDAALLRRRGKPGARARTSGDASRDNTSTVDHTNSIPAAERKSTVVWSKKASEIGKEVGGVAGFQEDDDDITAAEPDELTVRRFSYATRKERVEAGLENPILPPPTGEKDKGAACVAFLFAVAFGTGLLFSFASLWDNIV